MGTILVRRGIWDVRSTYLGRWIVSDLDLGVAEEPVTQSMLDIYNEESERLFPKDSCPTYTPSLVTDADFPPTNAEQQFLKDHIRVLPVWLLAAE